MQERDQSRLASGLTVLIGAWIALSPIWLNMPGGSATNAIVTGIIIAVFGAIQYFWSNTFPSWVTGIAAIWVFISAFFMTMSGGATLNMVVSAIAVFIISLWNGFEVDAIDQQHHHHIASN